MGTIFEFDYQLEELMNFSFQQNGIPTVQRMIVKNSSQENVSDLVVQITSSPKELCMPVECHLDGIPAGGEQDLKEFQPVFDTDYLVKLEGPLNASISYTVMNREGEVLGGTVGEILVLPANYWHGSRSNRELLAAFCTPNHDMIAPLLHRAGEILEERTGDSSLQAYQAGPNRVLQILGAIYDAIAERNITYAVSTPSFMDCGQSIRLVDEMLRTHLGNCMEMTLLFCACAEEAQLHPIFVLQPGHIFSGVWLEDKTFPNAVFTDASQIINRLEEGAREIVLVESTMMCGGKGYSFDQACDCAKHEIQEAMSYAVDVTQARRRHQIRPLPISPNGDEDNTFSVSAAPGRRAAVAPGELSDAEPDAPVPITYTRMQQWERHLLNLDLRNPLLNLSFNRVTTLPLCCGDMKKMLAALSSEDDFCICSLEGDGAYPDYEALGHYNMDDTDDFRQCRLRSPLKPEEILKRGKKLRALAKTSIEEKGGNTLFLGVGILRWQESVGAENRYAPILLYPVDITAANSGCKLRLREEEVQLNVTLVEKLKQDFRMQFPHWESLPTGSDGAVDVAKVLASFRQCIKEQSQWQVLPGAYVSNFNFSQFVLWRDLKKYPQVLEGNLLVSSLQEGRLKWQPKDKKFLSKLPEDTLVLPISVDGSQLFAIENTVEGETFVLQGPPGTGKSQTITGAIGAALREGKKVILVTEKLAGLNVVHKRLQEIGLAPFCLELHSDKSRKQDVLKHLDQVLELAENQLPPEEGVQAQDLEKLKGNLDAYAHALHRKGENGMSLYQLVTRYQDIGEGVDFDETLFPDPRLLTPEVMARKEAYLERLTLMRRALGNPATHALRQISATTYSQQYKQNLDRAIQGYASDLEELEKASEEFVRAYCPEKREEGNGDPEKLYEISRHLRSWSQLPDSWSSDAPSGKTLSDIKELAARCISVNHLRGELLEYWETDFLSLPGTQLLEEYRSGTGGMVVRRPLALHKLRKKLLPLEKIGIPADRLGEHLEKLVSYQTARKEVNLLKKEHQEALEKYFGQPPYRWSEISDTVECVGRTASCLQGLMGTGEASFQSSYVPGRCYPEAERMGSAWERTMESRSKVYGLLGIQLPPQKGDWLAQERDYCRMLSEQTDMLKEWIAWNALCEEARGEGMGAVVKACCTDTDPEPVCNGYRKALYRRIIHDRIDREPVLGEFTGLMFNEQIRQLRRVDRELQTQARQDIYNKVLNRISEMLSCAKVESNQLSTLKKAISSGGRGTTVRKLFEEMPELLLELCPCLLMSPVSVAQYLPMKNDLVDLVIFDEASQIPTSKAVGALARGKNAVIVGDVNQMPPTSFFSSLTLDEDNLETEDLDSILDDCLALDVPSTSLNWHYRSRHESLIAFSNAHFYDNKLLTFPSAQDRNSHVRLHRVENGVFDRGKSRRNPVEAQAVIEELCRMSKDEAYKDKSVGIITFNVEQQDLIEELLQEACRSNVALSSWCACAPEPIFVKNLENVQGDERDVILFSVGYGADATGKVHMNFGPLNKEGGWRRLNVAVSRARDEMQIFTSLTPEQIDLKRSSARGVKALRSFLEYAAGASLPASQNRVVEQSESGGIRDRLCRLLKEAGYGTEANVGFSDLRVDVAVIHPKEPDRYALGILLDGPSYASARTTRDRELSQVDVLKGLGWEIHRIWTVDWWENPRKEVRALLQKLESIQ